jgi:hypothetical protein
MDNIKTGPKETIPGDLQLRELALI